MNYVSFGLDRQLQEGINSNPGGICCRILPSVLTKKRFHWLGIPTAMLQSGSNVVNLMAATHHVQTRTIRPQDWQDRCGRNTLP